MDDLSYWLVFFSASLALNISPGPDLIYILSRTIAQGRKIGIASSIGVCTGALVHVTAAAIGLSSLLAASATAFSLVKYAGAVYLIYLGVKSFRSAGSGLDFQEHRQSRVTAWMAFKQGILIDVLNPKTAIFFMAFLPQFIRPESGAATAQIVILGLLVNLTGLVVESLFVMAAGGATLILRRQRKVSAYLHRLLGTIFIGLGIRLALTESGN